MKPIHVLLVGGARPNFMKLAPIVRALEESKDKFLYQLVHTGQHHDHGMSQVFFEELGIPEPHYYLGCAGGTHAVQTAKIMVAFEEVCQKDRPDIVLVVGDVNSTLACAIVAKKMEIKVAHVEAGLRSFDRTMPEEINRLVTDAITDYFFATEPSAVENLRKEGQPADKVFFVGHVMVDNLLYQANLLNRLPKEQTAYDLTLSTGIKQQYDRYAVLTMHRSANVDCPDVLSEILRAIEEIAKDIPVIFPVHPRTRQSIERFNIKLSDQIVCLPPLAYMDFLNLWKDAQLILTDSGGLQEETTALAVPCLTLRENTERPVTIKEGTNRLVGRDFNAIIQAAQESLLQNKRVQENKRPQFWDGQAATRIVEILYNQYNLGHSLVK